MFGLLSIFSRTSLKIYFAVTRCNVRLFHCLVNISKMPFYAVAKGRTEGIYNSWADCEAQVKGFSGAKFKKFDTASSAVEFMNSNSFNVKVSINHPSSSNHRASKNNLKRSYATSFTNTSQSFTNSSSTYSRDNEQDSTPSRDDLNDRTTKQLEIDDLEKREIPSEGIDKIVKASKAPQCKAKQNILIEPPQPKKYRHNEETDFEMDNEGYIQVYTDGACSSNGKCGARAGLGVFWGNQHHLNRSEPVSGRATNNCGEIQAATLAIKTAIQNGVKKLAINTDSKFLINSATKWMPGWKQKGWKLASGRAVKNEADFKELDSVLNKLEIKWNYVQAHSGLYGNEMADKLAKAGAVLYDK